MPPVTISDSGQAEGDPRLRVGTLRYTMAGMLWVFVWLLWGDFCFTVMEYVNNSIVPLRLRELHAPDWVLPVILTTVPSIINFTLNPVISTTSDRHRGRWGRRIPFLLFSAPFLSVMLVLMAFSPEVAARLHHWVGALGGWGIGTVTIFTIGILMASFKVFDMFVNTTFWYLFNDVVPQAFMARFMGMFRVVAALAAMIYNYFFYEHALTHMRWIYLGAAVIYLVGFTLMCLMVKEGEYPPPPPRPAKKQGFLKRVSSEISTYVRECLSHRLYVLYFTMGMFLAMANSIAIYNLYLNLSLGVNLKHLAMLNTGIQFSLLVLNYPAGALADRFHPIRVWRWMTGCLLVIIPLNFIWLFGKFTPEQAFRIMITLTAIDLPISVLLDAVATPLRMRLLPREKYGQFCSFNALAAALMNILGSLSVAWFMTGMRTLFPDAIWGKDFCYRLIPAWRYPFMVITTMLLWLLYREWKRQGGAENYTPPGFPRNAEIGTQPATNGAVALEAVVEETR